ncbi:hypothetical protein LJC56_02730 [Christensenellaceae bacterium OttesenSCG-928-K19]|nr:hypothetical protein [Christensenellaceae bacterium OttesenSCG-928-K19]
MESCFGGSVAGQLKEGGTVTISRILKDKTVRAKEKARRLAIALKEGEVSYASLYRVAQTAGMVDLGTCLEALCIVTKENPSIAKKKMLLLASSCLCSEGNRVKWEAAELIGNIAPLFKGALEEPLEKLFLQAGEESVVVRFNTCYALTTVLLMDGCPGREKIFRKVKAVAEAEKAEPVRKKYEKAIKKAKKRFAFPE